MATRNQTAPNEIAELRMIRRRQVEARTGLSRSTIYAGVAAGTFPKPIQLGAQAVGWLESEIDAWLRERVAASRGEAVQS
jgi:prophage regulatory protein